MADGEMTTSEKNDPAVGARRASTEGFFMTDRASTAGYTADDLRDWASPDLTHARQTEIGRILYRLYGATLRYRFRHIILKAVLKIEYGELYSGTLRKIFRDYHKVSVGIYTHGGCFVPGAFDKYTSIGRYCSVASPVRVTNRNHPMKFKSTHGLFFNPELGLAEIDTIRYLPLEIGHDVWIGHNAIILPSVRSIGTGAVVGAGSVVNKEVPPYAVVFGCPARVIGYRFSKETIRELLASRWWEKSLEEIRSSPDEYLKPYNDSVAISEPAHTSE
jgi:acetyltransferase-like isoleucine patch superfamily enzyme